MYLHVMFYIFIIKYNTVIVPNAARCWSPPSSSHFPSHTYFTLVYFTLLNTGMKKMSKYLASGCQFQLANLRVVNVR